MFPASSPPALASVSARARQPKFVTRASSRRLMPMCHTWNFLCYPCFVRTASPRPGPRSKRLAADLESSGLAPRGTGTDSSPSPAARFCCTLIPCRGGIGVQPNLSVSGTVSATRRATGAAAEIGRGSDQRQTWSLSRTLPRSCIGLTPGVDFRVAADARSVSDSVSFCNRKAWRWRGGEGGIRWADSCKILPRNDLQDNIFRLNCLDRAQFSLKCPILAGSGHENRHRANTGKRASAR